MQPLNELDEDLCTALAQRDLGRVIELYRQAADRCELENDADACCFYLTQAMVYALEAGSDNYFDIHRRLCAYGRESISISTYDNDNDALIRLNA